VDDLTIPQVQELTEYWRQSPPEHVLLDAIYDAIVVLGGGKPREKDSRDKHLTTEAECRALVGMLNRKRK
jgi:hypothetical protein